MAEQDSFIQEVSEEVRRDRMFSVWKKYGPILIGAIVLAVIGVATKDWWEGRIADEKQRLGGKFIEAERLEESGDQAQQFAALAQEAEYGYPVLARLRAGAAFGQAGDVERAIQEYEAVLSMPDVDLTLRTLAELRIVMLTSDTAPPKELLTRLTPLTAPDSPWRMQALEFEAGAHLRAGDREAAVASLERLIGSPGVPSGLSDRVNELIAALATDAPSLDAPATEAGAVSDDPAESGAVNEEQQQ